jgi:tyrosyl-tRNA synthetase
LLMGRELQKHFGQLPQCIITMPLLEGLDGVNKMSKSAGNYIGITENPTDMFGKLMSISDELMWRYIELLSFERVSVIRQWQQEVRSGRNPRDVKVMFAQELVARFHSTRDAESALADFEARFRRGGVPDDMPQKMLYTDAEGLQITQLLKQAGLTASTTEALRLIEQGGVRLNGEKVSDKTVKLGRGETAVVQVGKRKFARVTISS